jgi:lipoate-protein ligase A
MNKICKKLFTTLREDTNIIISKSINTIFNLSVEEFYYEQHSITKPILFLYQNDTNVVIGRHQNPWKECNLKLMEKTNTTLASK